MENLTHALYMAVAMMVFVIAFSVALYFVNKLNTTTTAIAYNLNDSYYDSYSLAKIIENNEDRNRSRIVGIDKIIPTLYRYYKESFAVKILDEDENLLQIFDTTAENDVNAAIISVDKSYVQNALISLYDDGNKACYMFGVPWLANINNDAKTRIDLYINGGKGYINNVFVDYSKDFYNINVNSKGYTDTNSKKIFLKNFKNRKFKEVFTQYAYDGDTISDESNGEIVSLTGSKQIATKIIIIYQLLP